MAKVQQKSEKIKHFPDYFLTKAPPRHEETEAATDFRFSILIFWELAPIPRCPLYDYKSYGYEL